MTTEDRQLTEENARLGFITVLGTVQTGLVGGLLILDRLGHPKEFYCTVPIRPNPAQEVLYGISLKPFLYGRQIAAALLKKGGARCFAVFTDTLPVLSIQEVVPYPVMMLFPASGLTAEGFDTFSPETLRGFRRDDWLELPPDSLHIDRLAVKRSLWEDSTIQTRIRQGLGYCQGNIELAEPFERIALAIQESQK